MCLTLYVHHRRTYREKICSVVYIFTINHSYEHATSYTTQDWRASGLTLEATTFGLFRQQRPAKKSSFIRVCVSVSALQRYSTGKVPNTLDSTEDFPWGEADDDEAEGVGGKHDGVVARLAAIAQPRGQTLLCPARSGRRERTDRRAQPSARPRQCQTFLRERNTKQ